MPNGGVPNPEPQTPNHTGTQTHMQNSGSRATNPFLNIELHSCSLICILFEPKQFYLLVVGHVNKTKPADSHLHEHIKK